MNTWVKRAAAAIVLAGAPALGLAQGQQAPAMPSYAVGKVETIRGTIASFNGATTMYVRDVRGYIDNVTLHQGTVINPTGIRLQPGYSVTISGRTSGSTFIADEIDTPYHIYGGYGYYPYPVYPVYAGVGLRWGWGWGWGWHRW
ncbi:MAG TPA: hypothetical protein VMA98_00235 [Candidatus Acidoferrales bacterium]|nr:hypothetical protein [Candidatus Acidoferrales bacterium]